MKISIDFSIKFWTKKDKRSLNIKKPECFEYVSKLEEDDFGDFFGVSYGCKYAGGYYQMFPSKGYNFPLKISDDFSYNFSFLKEGEITPGWEWIGLNKFKIVAISKLGLRFDIHIIEAK